MKKQLLAIPFAFLGVAATAQITITQADIAPLYSVLRQVQDTIPAVSPGSAGTNQTWVMTGLNTHVVDTLTFTLPQFTPFGPQIPGCNFAVIQTSPVASVTYIYLNNNSSALEIAGQAADPFGLGSPFAVAFSNPETVAAFAMNYGDTLIDNARGDGQFPLGFDPGIGFVIDSVRVHTSITKNGSVDGWGSLTTPLGTYNTLRLNVLRKQIDTIDIYAFGTWAPNFFSQEDSSRVYTYWANGLGFPLAELTDQQDLGQITRANWLQAVPQVIGVPECFCAYNAGIYPNPANTQMNLFTDNMAAVSARIYDIAGKEVGIFDLLNGKGTLDVNNYPAGLYFFRTTDVSGTILEQGKFAVSR